MRLNDLRSFYINRYCGIGDFSKLTEEEFYQEALEYQEYLKDKEQRRINAELAKAQAILNGEISEDFTEIVTKGANILKFLDIKSKLED